MTAEPRDGRYLVQDFDVRAAGTSLGRFAYLTHILRDVALDMNESRVYLPDATLASHALDEGDLRRMVALGRGDARWSSLVHEVAGRARAFADAGDAATAEVRRLLPKDRAFILSLIVDTYREILRRIVAAPDRCLGTGPVLLDSEQRALARRIALRLFHVPKRRAFSAAPGLMEQAR